MNPNTWRWRLAHWRLILMALLSEWDYRRTQGRDWPTLDELETEHYD